MSVLSKTTKKYFASVNPVNNQVVKEFKEISSKILQTKIQQSHQAFLEWKLEILHKRSAALLRLAEMLRNNKENYAQLMTLEMGKPINESRAEIEKCATTCEYFAEHAKFFLHDEPVKTEAQNSFISYEPLGVVLGIMPWNYPFWQVIRFSVPALMAGNAVLLKHASGVPQCALAIEEAFAKSGFPENLFQNLFISEMAVKKVLEHPLVKMVSLTGSERAGSAVAAIAGKNIKKSVLELGGSDPFIVLNDADLKTTVENVVRARMQNSGQSCIAAKRFIVEKSVVNTFTEMVSAAVQNLKTGNPKDKSIQIGPLANEHQAKQVMNQIEQSIKQGAEALCGGYRPTGGGAYVMPTVLSNVKPGMVSFEEEIFGPVLSIITAENEEHAIALANQTRFGLGASIWTTDTERATRIARKINAGVVFVNGIVKSDPRLPFGGINASGYGRELSVHGIREFVNIKTIWVA